MKHFTIQYLFISGDQNPRNSSKIFGEFYKIDAVFIVLGLIYLLLLRSRVTLILLAWILLAPIPSSLVSGAPNATRALFMMGSINLIAALGAGQIISRIKGRSKIPVLIIILTILAVQSYSYLQYYFGDYAKNNAIDWQYGMKQIVEYVKVHPEYREVYMTDIRSQPYIFFLYYLKIPLWKYINTVTYNRSETKSFSAVSNFGKYYFGGWDTVESTLTGGVLYVITDSQYDGLKNKLFFKVKKKIYFPNGSDAFYLVSAE